MASETTAANPELLQEQVANLLVQPLPLAAAWAPYAQTDTLMRAASVNGRSSTK
jgi:hypothetical protein